MTARRHTCEQLGVCRAKGCPTCARGYSQGAAGTDSAARFPFAPGVIEVYHRRRSVRGALAWVAVALAACAGAGLIAEFVCARGLL